MTETLENTAQKQEKTPAMPAMNFVLMDTPGTEPVTGVYAHHQAQELCDRNNKPGEVFVAPGLVGVIGGLPKLADGEYLCTVYDVPATLFFWTRSGVERGLIVLNTDAEGFVFAKQKFDRRSIGL